MCVAAMRGGGRRRAPAGGAGTRDSDALQDELTAAIDVRREAARGVEVAVGHAHTHTRGGSDVSEAR